jgi:hypothetical protein
MSRFGNNSSLNNRIFVEQGNMMENLKKKLACEWKNIFRSLNLQDVNSTGKIT